MAKLELIKHGIEVGMKVKPATSKHFCTSRSLFLTLAITLGLSGCGARPDSEEVSSPGSEEYLISQETFDVAVVEHADFRLPPPLEFTVREKQVGSTDYVFTMQQLRADDFRPARLAPLGGGYVFTTSLQNLEDMTLTDINSGEITLLGKLPLNETAGGANWVWPRILDMETIRVVESGADGRRRPVQADILMSVSVYDGAGDRQCQFIFVKTFRVDLTGANKHEFVENWFDSPCVPEKVGHNHSWESGGGLALIPKPLRANPDRPEYMLSLGHFLAVHTNKWTDEWRATLTQKEIDTITATLALRAPGEYEIFARGFRNAQGLVYAQSGMTVDDIHLLGTEHGPYSGDEINLIEEGKFYGWPLSSFGRRYNANDGYATPKEGLHHKYQRPIFYFAEASLAISPIITVNAPVFAGRWSKIADVGLADILVGAMSKGSLYRLVFDGERILTAEELPLGFRPRSLIEMDDKIIIGSDEDVLAVLTPTLIRQEGEFRPLGTEIAEFESSADGESALHAGETQGFGASKTANLQNGEDVFNRCAACHLLSGDARRAGPTLEGLFGRPIANIKEYKYSAALKGLNTRWTETTLDQFIENPRSYAPGTTMGFAGIPDPTDRRDLIAYLKKAAGEWEGDTAETQQ